MKGKTFEYEVSASLKAISDEERYFFFMRLLDNARVSITVPADFFALHSGQSYMFECKSCKSSTSFPFANIKQHQLDDLVDVVIAGGKSYVLIKHSCRKPKVYAIDVYKFIFLMRESKHKSFKWEELEDKAVVITKKNGIWDLWPLFRV